MKRQELLEKLNIANETLHEIDVLQEQMRALSSRIRQAKRVLFSRVRTKGETYRGYRNGRKNLARHIAHSEDVITNIETKKTAIINSDEYKWVLFLPEKYRTSYAVECLHEYIKNMRADTLKEAINLYETEYRQII
jgi:hypothetical protein